MKVNSESLYEFINDGIIKANTKIKVYKDDVYVTTITFDGYDFIWETGTFSSGMLFNPLCDFEIIDEEDIEEINKSYPIFHFDEKSFAAMKEMIQDIYSKQCEIIRELNKIKKEGK